MSTSNNQCAVKRQRIGTSRRTSYHDSVLIDDNGDGDYDVVYHHETLPRRLGNEVTTGTSSRSVAPDNNQWALKVTWAPQDDQNYALDTDGASYDMAVEAEVMEEHEEQEIEVSKNKNPRSRVSVITTFYLSSSDF